jgi:hypothetical protein
MSRAPERRRQREDAMRRHRAASLLLALSIGLVGAPWLQAEAPTVAAARRAQ